MKNYHTHTYRCHHASGDVKDYAREALSQGGRILGISDHVPLPDGRWPEVRMDMEEIQDYLDAIQSASEAYPSLEIIPAFECEWSQEFRGYYENELLGPGKVRYLIGAEHYVPYRGEWIDLMKIHGPGHLRAFADNLIGAMESGLFLFIAHPDCYMCAQTEWSPDTEACARDIIAAAKETGAVLEVNGYGFRKKPLKTPAGLRRVYPVDPFWELAAEAGIPVVWNSDAHRPEDVFASITDCKNLADRFGLIETDLYKRLSQPIGI